MRKKPTESWLHFYCRSIADLARDPEDWKYWSNVFAMAGSACLAVAFIQWDKFAAIVGVVFCLYGLKLNRRK